MRTARCQICSTYFHPDDHIHLDEVNSMRHIECYENNLQSIKDTGTYRDIVDKYPFFSNLSKLIKH